MNLDNSTMSAADIDDLTAQLAGALGAHVKARIAEIDAAAEAAKERLHHVAPVEYDVLAAAKYLGIGERKLRQLVTDRALAYRRQGNRLRFPQSALDAYKASTERRAREPRIVSQAAFLKCATFAEPAGTIRPNASPTGFFTTSR